MGIIKKNKNVIGVIKNGHPVTKIYKGNFLYYNVVPEFDIDLEFKEINGTYGQAFKLNDISITPTGSTYQANLADLGIENVTSFNFANTNLSKINRFPDCTNVTTLPQQPFAYTKLGYLDTASLNLNNLRSADFLYAYMPDVEGIRTAELSSNITSFQGYYGGCSSLKCASFPAKSHIKNISYLFYDCGSLTDVGTFPMYTSVENASSMFKRCSSLDMQSLLSNSTYNGFKQMFKFSPIKNVSSMFQGCNFGNSAFDSSYLSEWQMNLVEDASYLFADTNASAYELYYWDMWRCKNWSHMFQNCTSLTNISFVNKDFAGAEDFSYMFANCSNLSYVAFGSVNNLTGVTNFEGMFSGCYSLQTVECDDCGVYDLLKQALESSGLDVGILQDTSGNCGGGSDTDSGYFEWHEMTSDTPKDVSFTTIKIDRTIQSDAESDYLYILSTQSGDDIGMFPNYIISPKEGFVIDNGNYTFFSDVTDKDVYVYTFSQPVYFSKMETNAPAGAVFYGTPLKTTEIGDKIEWEWQNTGDDQTSIYINGYTNYHTTNPAEEWNNIEYNSCNQMFSGTNITRLNVMRGVYGVTTMNSMFRECQYLTSIDISNWNTSTVENLNEMFYRCENLDTVVMKNWDVSNVQYTMNMFFDCSKLRVLDLSGWNLTYNRLVNHSDMFYNCTSLEKIILIGCGNNTQSIIENALSNSGLLDQVEIVTEASE